MNATSQEQAFLSGEVNASWSAAMETLKARTAEEFAYDKAVWMPAYHASQGGPTIPEHIGTRMEQLVDAREDAEGLLIVSPAPNLSAVIWKMEYANKRWEGFCGWPEDWWNAVIKDLRRFEGG